MISKRFKNLLDKKPDFGDGGLGLTLTTVTPLITVKAFVTLLLEQWKNNIQ